MSFETQCWICPKCHDDQAKEEACTEDIGQTNDWRKFIEEKYPFGIHCWYCGKDGRPSMNAEIVDIEPQSTKDKKDRVAPVIRFKLRVCCTFCGSLKVAEKGVWVTVQIKE